ncbi:MAG TPA: deoxynucleoside kinase [Chloroflexia bacterium]|nr:deoxynucleoside kinase [Chloroflexia bacterium]
MKYFVAVAGNIGVGKSSLTSLLAERLGWEPFFEPVVENPYLKDFYSDMHKWSFQSQMFFLSSRLRHHQSALERAGSSILDRSIYEDAAIFAKTLHEGGYLSERDWHLYNQFYSVLATLLPPPNLVIYLQASVPTLLRRIAQRGRDFEQSLSTDYLLQLNERYVEWASTFNLCPVLTVATDNIDFVHHEAHLDRIVQRVQDRLGGRELITLGQPTGPEA